MGTFLSAHEDAEPQCVRSVQNSMKQLTDGEIDSLFYLSHVHEPELHKLKEVIWSYSCSSAKGNLDLGQCGAINHRIAIGGATPVFQKVYRIPYLQKAEMNQQVGEMMKKEIVELFKSLWGSPALLVEKPD